MLRGRKRQAAGSRRSKYAPKPDQVGTRKYLPVGITNTGGFIMFGLIGLAILVEFFDALRDGRGNDPIAIAVVFGLFATMVYLFGTTRVRE